MEDADLAAIRQRRLAELAGKQGSSGSFGPSPTSSSAYGGKQESEQEQRQAREDEEEQRRTIMSQILDNQARERLSRINLVKPSKARAIQDILLNMARSGQLRGRVTEEQLIGLLEQVERQQASFEKDSSAGKITFSRKRETIARNEDSASIDSRLSRASATSLQYAVNHTRKGLPRSSRISSEHHGPCARRSVMLRQPERADRFALLLAFHEKALICQFGKTMIDTKMNVTVPDTLTATIPPSVRCKVVRARVPDFDRLLRNIVRIAVRSYHEVFLDAMDGLLQTVHQAERNATSRSTHDLAPAIAIASLIDGHRRHHCLTPLSKEERQGNSLDGRGSVLAILKMLLPGKASWPKAPDEVYQNTHATARRRMLASSSTTKYRKEREKPSVHGSKRDGVVKATETAAAQMSRRYPRSGNNPGLTSHIGLFTLLVSFRRAMLVNSMIKAIVAAMLLATGILALPAPLRVNKKQAADIVGPDSMSTFTLIDTDFSDPLQVRFSYHIHKHSNVVDLFDISGATAKWYRSGESPDTRTVEHCFKFTRGEDWVIPCFRWPRDSPYFSSWYFDSFYTVATLGDPNKINRVILSRDINRAQGDFDDLPRQYNNPMCLSYISPRITGDLRAFLGAVFMIISDPVSIRSPGWCLQFGAATEAMYMLLRGFSHLALAVSSPVLTKLRVSAVVRSILTQQPVSLHRRGLEGTGVASMTPSPPCFLPSFASFLDDKQRADKMIKAMLATLLLAATTLASPASVLSERQSAPTLGPDNLATFALTNKVWPDVVFQVEFSYHVHLPGMSIDLFKVSGATAKWHSTGESPDTYTIQQCYKLTSGDDWAIPCFRFPRGGTAIMSWYLDSFYTRGTGSDPTQVGKVTLTRDASRQLPEFSDVIPREYNRY
ncbi:uncharacterized protein L969DRAFT_94947 [Mixia osmundae IAM 14324]|uniref:Programmed cell death protein 5 n=1 Tax=Mixia osmundae (strain CBS 9802 / IAM 14324 / JCM 22182 / KY 12970) TaxID=764103 RepID=G7E183_MIXOS|nr:uncharacterized protein L969DRAFT_94947 [Mixia osmundae IAM 14324]KEI38768.1 hypothetical protein L969DRAFT_94947 [Mixia osmundae IAM 14324]GAA96593.1 hypothetical protein E5Q_03263 [Mixia osmundae IAM 14324]